MSQFQKLYQKHEKRLDETQLIQKAYKSSLYHERWKKRNINVKELKGYKGLKEVPFTSANDMRIAWADSTLEDFILTETVGFWYKTSGFHKLIIFCLLFGLVLIRFNTYFT